MFTYAKDWQMDKSTIDVDSTKSAIIPRPLFNDGTVNWHHPENILTLVFYINDRKTIPFKFSIRSRNDEPNANAILVTYVLDGQEKLFKLSKDNTWTKSDNSNTVVVKLKAPNKASFDMISLDYSIRGLDDTKFLQDSKMRLF